MRGGVELLLPQLQDPLGGPWGSLGSSWGSPSGRVASRSTSDTSAGILQHGILQHSHVVSRLSSSPISFLICQTSLLPDVDDKVRCELCSITRESTSDRQSFWSRVRLVPFAWPHCGRRRQKQKCLHMVGRPLREAWTVGSQVQALRAVEKHLNLDKLYVLGTNCVDNGPREGLETFLKASSTRPDSVLHYEFMQVTRN